MTHRPRAGQQFADAMNALETPGPGPEAGTTRADDVDELLAAADRLERRGDRVGTRAAAKLRRKANGQRFADALDEAGIFTGNTALELENDLADTTDTTKETNR